MRKRAAGTDLHAPEGLIRRSSLLVKGCQNRPRMATVVILGPVEGAAG